MSDELSLNKLNSTLTAFEKYYHDAGAGWGGNSGPGSNAYFTIEYRGFLDKFMNMNGVRSVIDIGCGDWQFSRFINYDRVKYLGLDIVESVIENNRQRYRSGSVSFAVMPKDLTQVPGADLLIMKDVLQHLSNSDIMSFRNNVFPKFRYVLLTNSYEKLDTGRNVDILSGSFRCLDLTAPPFLFEGSYLLEFSSPVWERIRIFLYKPS